MANKCPRPIQTDMTDNLRGISRNWISQFLVDYPGNFLACSM